MWLYEGLNFELKNTISNPNKKFHVVFKPNYQITRMENVLLQLYKNECLKEST